MRLEFLLFIFWSVEAMALDGTLSPFPFNIEATNSSCPAPARKSIACPRLCVSSLSECPQVPSCPIGQFYCADGNCRAGPSAQVACAAAVPVCSSCKYGTVGTTPQGTYYPCKPLGNVEVSWYNPKDFTPNSSLLTTCASAAGLDYSKIAPIGPSAYFEMCIPKQPRFFGFLEAEFTLFYLFLAFESTVLASFYIYKLKREKKVSDSSKLAMKASKRSFDFESESSGSLPKHSLVFVGYKQTSFGRFVKSSLDISSFFWIFILGILCLDYYGVFARVADLESDHYFDNHEALSIIFVIVWHLAAAWFVGYRLSMDSIDIFTSLRTSLLDASLVQIQKQQEVPIYTSNMGKIARFVVRIERKLKNVFLLGSNSTIVPVQTERVARHR